MIFHCKEKSIQFLPVFPSFSSWCGCVCLPGHSPNPMLLKFYGSFLMQTWSIINSISSSSLLSGEVGRRDENFKLLIMTWSFWWPAPTQEPPRGTSLEQKMLLVFLSQKFTGFLGFFVPGTGRDIHVFFYYLTTPHWGARQTTNG